MSVHGGGLPANTVRILAQDATASNSHTGDTNEYTFASITIPANSMGVKGRIEVDTSWTTTSSANNKTLRVKFGGSTLSQGTLTTSASARLAALIANRGATNSQIGSSTGTSPYGGSSAALSTAAIDTTADVTLLITGQLANTGETITLEAYTVKLFPAT